MDEKHLDECLIAWNEGVRQGLQEAGYRFVADDVAQEIVLEMLTKNREGRPVPTWPGSLPAQMRDRAIQQAKGMSDLVFEPFEDRVQPHPPNYESHRKRKVVLSNLKKIEHEFTKPLLDYMIKYSNAQNVTQQYLANKLDIPYRTFKYKIWRLKR